MRDVRDELAVLRLRGLQPPDRVLEGGGHPVEPLRPRAELVARRHRDARREVAELDPLGGPRGGLDRGEHAAGDPPSGQERDERQDERAAAEPETKQPQRGLEPANVVDEVELRVAAGQDAADDELRFPARATSTGTRSPLRPSAATKSGGEDIGEVRLDVAEVGDEVDVPAADRLAQPARVERRARGLARVAMEMRSDRSKPAWIAASSLT